MKHITNIAISSYRELWKKIFPYDYKDKYTHHESNLSGGGGDYPFYDIHLKETVILTNQSRFCRASSIEYFEVPDCWYLRTGNKSSLARNGIDTSFNNYIDNGFKGYLTIEIVNNSNETIELMAGQPILKVEAIPCLFKCEPYQGKYQNQPDRPVGRR